MSQLAIEDETDSFETSSLANLNYAHGETQKERNILLVASNPGGIVEQLYQFRCLMGFLARRISTCQVSSYTGKNSSQ
jgi:hypothetical protein